MARQTCSLCKQSGHNKRTCPSLVAEEKDDCPICYEEIMDKNFCVTKCGHKFCMDCMPKHLQNNQKCPLCRDQVAPEISSSNNGDDGWGFVPYWVSWNQAEDAWEEGHEKGLREGLQLRNELQANVEGFQRRNELQANVIDRINIENIRLNEEICKLKSDHKIREKELLDKITSQQYILDKRREKNRKLVLDHKNREKALLDRISELTPVILC